MQLFYLLRKKATYSEYFFGFRRSVVDPQTKSLKPLTKLHVFLSIFFEVLLPYLKHKIQRLFDEVEWLRQRPKLKKLFSLLCYAVEVSLFSYQFRYLVDPKQKYFKPYLRATSIMVRRQNQFEMRQENEKSGSSVVMQLFQQYNIFALFLFMKYCEWHFSGRNQQASLASQQLANQDRKQKLIHAPVPQFRIVKKG